MKTYLFEVILTLFGAVLMSIFFAISIYLQRPLSVIGLVGLFAAVWIVRFIVTYIEFKKN